MKNSNATFFYPFLADIGALVLFFFTYPLLSPLFTPQPELLESLNNSFFFLLLYLLFLVGVFLLQTVKGPPLPYAPWLRTLLALPVVAVVLYGFGTVSGFFRTAVSADFGDTGTSYYFLLTPAVFVFISALYLFVLSLETDTPRPLFATAPVALFLVSYTLLLIISLVANSIGGIRPALTVPAFLILGSLPRQLYALKTGQIVAWLSFCLISILLAISTLF